VPGGGRELRVANLAPPAAPSGLAAGPGSVASVKGAASGGVVLRWVDHSDNESGFVIDRSSSPVFGTLNQSFFVGPNVTSYTDSTATPGQYYYRVRAVNAAGFSVFSNTTAPPTVVDRHIFYNNSAWDGNNATETSADDGAIASDKQALLPGQTASFANFTSYSAGINGIMVDIANVAQGAALSSFDFQFRVGNSSTPGNWTAVTAPVTVLDRPGAGTGGSDRVELVWADNAIQDQWLQVTVLATSHTGLAAPDLFYFGNAIASTDNNGNPAVTAADEILARNNATGLGAAAITNLFDFNRDKHVNAQDQLIARANLSGLNPLQMITAPPASAPPGTSTTSTSTPKGTTAAPKKPALSKVVKIAPTPIKKKPSKSLAKTIFSSTPVARARTTSIAPLKITATTNRSGK
jgi:hypothetical protein